MVTLKNLFGILEILNAFIYVELINKLIIY